MQGGLFLEMPFSLFSMAPCCLLGLFRENTGGCLLHWSLSLSRKGSTMGPGLCTPWKGFRTSGQKAEL